MSYWPLYCHCFLCTSDAAGTISATTAASTATAATVADVTADGPIATGPYWEHIFLHVWYGLLECAKLPPSTLWSERVLGSRLFPKTSGCSQMSYDTNCIRGYICGYIRYRCATNHISYSLKCILSFRCCMFSRIWYFIQNVKWCVYSFVVALINNLYSYKWFW